MKKRIIKKYSWIIGKSLCIFWFNFVIIIIIIAQRHLEVEIGRAQSLCWLGQFEYNIYI